MLTVLDSSLDQDSICTAVLVRVVPIMVHRMWMNLIVFNTLRGMILAMHQWEWVTELD